MTKHILQTARLDLREWNTGDSKFLFELNNDPEVVKYTGDVPFISEHEAGEFIENYDHYRKWGYGRWVCILRESGELVGWCGLKNQVEELGIVDLGFRFVRSQWGRGLATESAVGVVEFGFSNLALPEITARVAIGNDRSEGVIRKCGFHFTKESECEHHPARWFAIDREEWLKKQQVQP